MWICALGGDDWLGHVAGADARNGAQAMADGQVWVAVRMVDQLDLQTVDGLRREDAQVDAEVAVAAVDVVDRRLDDDGVVAAEVLVLVALEPGDDFRLDEVQWQPDPIIRLQRSALKRKARRLLTLQSKV